MAAPSPGTRTPPVGIKLDDGYRTKHAFAADPDVSLWEIEVGLPGVDGGPPIETSTMWNDVWRTRALRALKEQTSFTFKFAYDPVAYSQIIALCNVETTCTEILPDGSTIAYYGGLTKTDFDPLKEGEMPTGTATVTPTMWDPTNRVEAGPAVASVAGT